MFITLPSYAETEAADWWWGGGGLTSLACNAMFFCDDLHDNATHVS